MTLTELKYIVHVAEYKHFVRAAESCNVSQPTLSVAVKKLEEELGVAIFERSRHEVSLTPVGERIVQEAKTILQQVAHLKEIAQEADDQLSGQIKIGAIHTVGPYFFPHVIPCLKKLAPNLGLYIEEGFTRDLVERLKHGELDMILIAMPFTTPGIVGRPIYDEPLHVMMPKNHPWAQQKSIDPNCLAQGDLFILGAGNCFRDHVLGLCPDCFKSTLNHEGKTVEGGSLETIRSMVYSGMGATVLPATALRPEDLKSDLVSIKPFNVQASRQIGLFWRDSYPRTQVVDVMLKAVARCDLADFVQLIR
jgi:LysR family hydrogen peroxide-inducible transcriptional activator